MERVPDQGPEMGGPDRQAGDMPDIPGQRRGLRALQFGVAHRVLGEAVMLDMEIAEPFGRQDDQQPADPRRGLVEREALKRRAMHALMQRGKEEEDQYPLRQHQQRPARPLHRDQRPDQQDQPRMPGKMHQPLRIRAARQHVPLSLR